MHIMSPVAAINRLNFRHLTRNSVRKNCEVIVLYERTITIIKDSKGELFVEGLSQACYMPGDWWWLRKFLQALVKLKVIAKEDMDAHMEFVEKKATKEEMASDAKHFRKLLAKYQIEPEGSHLRDFLAKA